MAFLKKHRAIEKIVHFACHTNSCPHKKKTQVREAEGLERYFRKSCHWNLLESSILGKQDRLLNKMKMILLKLSSYIVPTSTPQFKEEIEFSCGVVHNLRKED